LPIGIELDELGVTAVSVDDGGHVAARASAASSGDVAAAARTVLAQVRGGAPGKSAPVSIGVAAAAPDAPAIADAIAALRGAGLAVAGAPLASGTAAAVAETWIGAARGSSDVAFFAVADRTMGGVVRSGVPLVGAHGRAVSVGWLALNPVEREDYRKVGCLEAEVAAVGIVRRLIWRIKAGDRSRVQDDVRDDLAAITIDHVLTAARAGDGVSVSVIRDTAKYLGMAAANLVAIADPEILVLGGIIASAGDLLLEPVRVEVGRRLPRSMLDGLTIATATLGGDAAAIGAARLASPALQ
jgi:predicted NBD/HSP70 family sugar kinase